MKKQVRLALILIPVALLCLGVAAGSFVYVAWKLMLAQRAGDTLGENVRIKSGPVLSRPVASAPVGPQVGDPAPEIEGEDIDGKRFKLSDYRGKVVLLDFWGNW